MFREGEGYITIVLYTVEPINTGEKCFSVVFDVTGEKIDEIEISDIMINKNHGESFQINPGITVPLEFELHQNYPTYVIECEGVNIAMDEKIVGNIFVWKGNSENNQKNTEKRKPAHGIMGFLLKRNIYEKLSEVSV